MRNQFLIAASMAALLSCAARAQQTQQDVPDAPQPQKQQPAKPAPKADTAPAPDNAKPPAGKNDNSFPEDVSRAAAKTAQQDDATPPADNAKPSAGKDGNAFPEDVSRAAAKKADQQDENTPGIAKRETAKPGTANPAASDSNPFPEDVSEEAAKPSVPPGVSSSQSQDSLEGGNKPLDPARAAKDAQVGDYYLKQKNYQGALLRYQDASSSDPTNVDAIFGLAETQRMLGKTADAAKNYQMYLDIVPNGPKAKESIKALKTLQAKK